MIPHLIEIEDPTAITDRDLIERHVHSVIVKPQALEVRLVLASATSVPTEEPNLNDPTTDQLPTTATIITLPWTAPSFTAVKGIVHAPSAKPELKPESRDALLIAIAKARGWINDIQLGRIASIAEIAKREGQGDIIVLDEATSALDPKSQDALMQLLSDEMKSLTLISVGHRPELEHFNSRKLVLERRRGGAKLVSDITLLRRPGKPRLIRRWLKRKLKTAA